MRLTAAVLLLASSPALAGGVPRVSLPAASFGRAAASGVPLGVPISPLEPTGNALILTPSLDVGLAALRAASHPNGPTVLRAVAAINAGQPELPVSPERLFLVREQSVLEGLDLGGGAGGAARVLTDGRAEAPVVLVNAVRPVEHDQFVEIAVHEGLHLFDGGILRVPHEAELIHLFAEGWTQLRAIGRANRAAALGRPETPGRAYQDEVKLAGALVARHGQPPLEELVREGSIAGLRRAYGDRWELAQRVVARAAPRERRVKALQALLEARSVAPADERALLRYVDDGPAPAFVSTAP